MSNKKVAKPKKPAEEMQENSTDICYTVSVPKLDENALNNLKALVSGKSNVIKKVFGVSELPIEESDDNLTFNWLPPDATQEEIHALMVFISKMCELAKNLKRVNLKEKEVENEKYAFRCFMIRLGMLGKEYKRDRAVMLSKLEGSSSFKNKKGKEKDE